MHGILLKEVELMYVMTNLMFAFAKKWYVVFRTERIKEVPGDLLKYLLFSRSLQCADPSGRP